MQDEISKTRRKKEMTELQALGAALVALSDPHLEAVGLDGSLKVAVIEARRLKTHEAKRRQMQYIGRLMRKVDSTPIRERLNAISGHSASAAAAHRRLETWRERLLAADEALTEFAATHPGADIQVLRALIRNTRKEQKTARPPRAFRDLFRYIKECSASNPS